MIEVRNRVSIFEMSNLLSNEFEMSSIYAV